MPELPATRRITLRLPADLVGWLHGFAEISHRSVDDLVRQLVETERARVDANWDRAPVIKGDAEPCPPPAAS